jgi:hypothetical protein
MVRRLQESAEREAENVGTGPCANPPSQLIESIIGYVGTSLRVSLKATWIPLAIGEPPSW